MTVSQVGPGLIKIQLANVLDTKTVYTGATGHGIDFVDGLGADVVVDYVEQNIRYPGQSHRRRCLQQPGLSGVRLLSRTVEQSFGIMQTVTSAVRIDVG